MKSKSPSSPDGSLPPRHRPMLNDLAKDTTERNLWDFEDALDLPEIPEIAPLPEMPRSSEQDIPTPRESPLGLPRGNAERSPSNAPGGGEEKIRMNVNARSKIIPMGSTTPPSKPENDFDDLESWQDPTEEFRAEDLSGDDVSGMTGEETHQELKMAGERVPEILSETASEMVPEVMPEPVKPVEEKVGTDDEFSPVPRENTTPISLRPHLRLSMTERINLIVLVALLLAGAVSVLVFSLKHLPTESVRAQENDFPIKGGNLSVVSATTYWRAPIMEGPVPDTVRRNTMLLPVLELVVSGGPAAIRVLFRNEDGVAVGDVVTRAISGAATLQIPATTGFDDIGMHAAYRTGEKKPWTIEVSEGSSVGERGIDFKLLFKMNISTDLH